MNCEKTRYETQIIAVQAIRALSTRYNQSFHSYKCSDCGGWHIHSVKDKKLKPLKDWVKPDHYEKPFKFQKPSPQKQVDKKQKSVTTTGRIMTKEQAEMLKAKFADLQPM